MGVLRFNPDTTCPELAQTPQVEGKSSTDLPSRQTPAAVSGVLQATHTSDHLVTNLGVPTTLQF